jgi:hypothetical protein
VHDLKIQPDENHLLIGTHGRSIYKASVSPLQSMSEDMASRQITLFEVAPVRHSNRWGSSWSQWLDAFEPEARIQFYSNSAGTENVTIVSENGDQLYKMSAEVDEGFNYLAYNMELSEKGRKALMKSDKDLVLNKASNGKYYLPKGSYNVVVGDATTELTVK